MDAEQFYYNWHTERNISLQYVADWSELSQEERENWIKSMNE